MLFKTRKDCICSLNKTKYLISFEIESKELGHNCLLICPARFFYIICKKAIV